MAYRLTPPEPFQKLAARISSEIRSALNDSLSMAEREVKTRYSGPTGSASLSVRTGKLRTSARGRELRGGPPPRPMVARFFSQNPPPYAHIHEHGGTITPKAAQYLTIPLPGATGLTAGRGPGRRIRDFPGGFFFRSRAGNLIYARGRGRGLPPLTLFLLRKSVRIPARPVWSESAKAIAPAIASRFRRAVDAIVRAAG